MVSLGDALNPFIPRSTFQMPPDSFHTLLMPNLSIFLRLSPYALPSPWIQWKNCPRCYLRPPGPGSTRSHVLCSCNCPPFSCIFVNFTFLANYFHEQTNTLHFFSTEHTHSFTFLCSSYSLQPTALCSI